jgi:hypothetical protein
MKCIRYLFLLLMPLVMSIAARADQFSFQGNLPTDDYLQAYEFTVTTAGLVTLKTLGYAGGTNGLGDTILGGGFDPLLTLFDGDSNFIVANDDGGCGAVGTDASTLNCFDSALSIFLQPGFYGVILSESGNFALGSSFFDSFSQVGNGNFTCPQFLGTAGGFCDASPSHRNSSFALDITTPDSQSVPVSTVPEPAPGVLLLSGLGLFFVLRNQMFAAWR